MTYIVMIALPVLIYGALYALDPGAWLSGDENLSWGERFAFNLFTWPLLAAAGGGMLAGCTIVNNRPERGWLIFGGSALAFWLVIKARKWAAAWWHAGRAPQPPPPDEE